MKISDSRTHASTHTNTAQRIKLTIYNWTLPVDRGSADLSETRRRMGPPAGPLQVLALLCDCRTIGIFNAAEAPPAGLPVLLVGNVGTTPTANDVCGPTAAMKAGPNGGGGGGGCGVAESSGEAMRPPGDDSLTVGGRCGVTVTVRSWRCCCCCWGQDAAGKVTRRSWAPLVISSSTFTWRHSLGLHSTYATTPLHWQRPYAFIIVDLLSDSLQCFDNDGWATGRASGL